jgi:RNA polymerase nonessential primary-like sigma factor
MTIKMKNKSKKLEERMDTYANYVRQLEPYSTLSDEEQRSRFAHIRVGYEKLADTLGLVKGQDYKTLYPMYAAVDSADISSVQDSNGFFEASEESIREQQRDLKEKFEDIYLHNLPLVISYAKMHHTNHLHMMDLIQEGNLGLRKAVRMYDHTYEVDGNPIKFSTYAWHWVGQYIKRAIHNKEDEVRIPVYIHAEKMQLNKTSKELQSKVDGYTQSDLLKELNWNTEKLDFLSQTNFHEVSISNTEDSDTLYNPALEHAISLNNPYNPKIDKVECDVAALVEKGLSKLTPRERKVMERRFRDEKTLEEIGLEMGVTRERVRQIEAKTLRKLQKNPYMLMILRPR